MQFIESSIIGLRSAAITLGHRDRELSFVLFPMVHVGERAFFEAVQRRAAACDLIVAEGAPSRYAPAQAWLSRQRTDDLVDQLVALDLEATGVPVQWEVVTAAPPKDDWRSRAADVGSAAVLKMVGRFGNPMGIASLEQTNAREMRIASDDSMLGRALNHLVFDSRDAQLVRTVELLERSRGAHAEKIAVVYGAAHIPAVVDHLCERLGYFVRDSEWLTVASASD